MIDVVLNKAREQMRRAVDITKQDLAAIHSGRATPILVENLVISAYGDSQKLKLKELATITTPDAKTLAVAPFDPSVILEIERGILEANTGLSPVIDGEMIRISIPPLSAERRLEYIKLARAKLEGGRIMIRQIRQETMRELKRTKEENEMSEDERSHGEKLVQELTDEMIAEIDALGLRKEEELLRV